MADTNPQFLSGKVKVTSPLSASSDRYRFLNLQNAEPNLGFPAGGGVNQRYVLLSNTLSGTRVWSSSASIALSGNNVGIGTQQPNEKLTVVGNISATGTIYGFIEGLSGGLRAAGLDTQVQFNSAGFLKGDPAFTYNQSNSSLVVGFRSSSSLNNTFVFGSNIVAALANYTYVNGISSSGPIIGTAGSLASLNITQGLAGIGTTTPNEKLTVVGNISATGVIYGTLSGQALNAAGGDTEVQYNSGGKFTASSAFTYKHATSSFQFGLGSLVSPSAIHSSILGGRSNRVTDNYSVVTAGQSNSATNVYVSVGGGLNNLGAGDYSTIGGGCNNVASSTHSTIGGGDCNCAIGVYSIIGGGRTNISNSDYSTIGGGIGNCTSDTYAVVGGGFDNNSSGYSSTIAGGRANAADGFYSVIGGGWTNNVTGDCSGILGGANNVVTHANSFAIGSNIKSSATCTTFVNNISAINTSCANIGAFNSLSATSINVTNATLSQTATATNAFITIMVGGSALALSLFRIN